MHEVLGLPGRLAGAGRCLVMGVINVTPDSFSDGGLWSRPEAAVDHGLRLLAEGADLLDVGGESTRPGAGRVPVEEELRRVLPVIRGLAGQGAVVSVDTSRAVVARAALDAGALIVNDVSAGQADPDMAALVARTATVYVAMHWRGPSAVMQDLAGYDDVVTDVVTELRRRIELLAESGVDLRRLILDPGLGFAKTAEHNWQLLARLGELTSVGLPVLVGASRKRFLGSLLTGPDGEPAPPGDRDAATTATTALAAAAGAWAVRVHAVRPSADAVRVAAAVRGAAVRGAAAPA
ncbi:MAG TPA: dihydropteroate synthase, partial [Kineosporiaceae bacterium]